MLLRRLITGMFSVSMVLLGTGLVFGQDPSTGLRTGYPNKPIRMVTSGFGGGTDLTSRLIAPGVSALLGQPIIIDNRVPLIAIETVAKAPSDGYTLLAAGGPVWISPLLQKVSYDPIMDFSPIAMVSAEPNLLVVHSSLAVKSVKELIALAKAKPGELNYASSSIGGGPHLSAELFKAMAGVNIVRINYKGAAPALSALIGGEVQLMFVAASAVSSQVKSGKLIALAVTSAQQSVLAPGLPTIAASGVPGYESRSLTAMFAPAKTPAAIIKRLNQEIARVISDAAVKEKLLNMGAEATPGSPQELAAAMKSDMARMGKVIKDAGIKVD